MVHIRVLTSIVGDRFDWEPGEVVDLPGPEAAVWADGVRAEYVDSPEQAAAEKAAVRSRGGGRGRRPEKRG